MSNLFRSLSTAIFEDGVLKSAPEMIEEPGRRTRSEEFKDSEKEKRKKEEREKRRKGAMKTFRIGLSKISETYELENFSKRALLIINNRNILDYIPRYGTEKDVAALEDTFCKIGFEITITQDLTYKEVMKTIHQFSEQDFTDYGCIAVAVLSHGGREGQIFARDKLYREQDIISRFTNSKPTLSRKPKIFIIQACRGMETSRGVLVSETEPSRTIVISKDEDEKSYNLPIESDMLICHSSYNGKASFRDTQTGSWFIQSLCSKINQLAETHDLESILTQVKREVAIEYTFEDKRSFQPHIHKQMPVVTSTLIRKLYFRKYIEKVEITPEIRHQMMDEETKVPAEQKNKNCSCYLDHFEYMRNCLKFYLEYHPNDNLARNFYDIAEGFHGPAFDEPKKTMIMVILQHLENKNFKYLKYIRKPSMHDSLKNPQKDINME